jgi:lysophospholipase L1-like esterase
VSPAASWFERNPRKTLFGVLATALVLTLAVGEYAFERDLRETTRGRRHVRLKEHAPNLNLVSQASRERLAKQFRLEIDSLEEKQYTFRTDADGFVMPARVHADPQLTLVFLGGSTTECYWVDEASRFPSLSGRLLGERLDKRVNALNAGVSGANTLHLLFVLMSKVIPLRPDVVVLMENVNDVNVMLFTGSYWSGHRTRSVIEEQANPGRLELLGEAIRQGVFPGIAQRLERSGLLKQTSDEFAGWRGAMRASGDVDTRDYEANLITFTEACRTRGIIPVLMTQFNRLAETPDEVTARNMQAFERDWGMGYAAYKASLDRFNEAVRRVARERGVLLVDLEAHVPKQGRYMYDIVHLNSAGSELVAGVVAEELAKSDDVRRRADGR